MTPEKVEIECGVDAALVERVHEYKRKSNVGNLRGSKARQCNMDTVNIPGRTEEGGIGHFEDACCKSRICSDDAAEAVKIDILSPQLFQNKSRNRRGRR